MPLAPIALFMLAQDVAPTSHERMVALLARLAEEAAATDAFVGLGGVEAAREELAALPAGEQLKRRWKLLRELGAHALRLGNEREALDHFQAAIALHSELGKKLKGEDRHQARFDLALAWLRYGETQNCVARHSSKSCILPIAAEGVHVDQEGSRNALRILARLIEGRPQDVAAMWLYNVAAMTVGEWPDEVPEDWRVPRAAFESAEAFPRFDDVAPGKGLATFNLSGGAVVDDFDGDGVLDVLTSTWDPSGPIHFFRGDGGGAFTERTSEVGLDGILGGLNLVHADYDSDGDADALVLRGAWLGEGGKLPNSLLRNDGGRFTDVTFDAGLGAVHYPTQTAAWADFDNDGDLDLYIGNESEQRHPAPSQLFRNDGAGGFVDVAAELGVTNDRYAKGVTWGDFDGDRWPDLYVSNLRGPNRLFHNAGGEGFVDIAQKAKLSLPADSFPTWWWDYDNDGLLDLFVGSYRPTVEGVAGRYLGRGGQLDHPWLYRQLPSGKFRAVQREAGFGGVACVMGANFGDVDRDGWLDVYLGTGYPGYEGLMPNLFYWNRSGAFADVTMAGGFGHAQKGHAVSFADLDEDGDTDLFVQMGGAFPGDAFGNALFENPGFGHHWLDVQLVGVRSNTSAIGARIRADFSEDGAPRSVYRHVTSGGSFGGNPLTQTLGLGGAERVERLEVYWPTSDTTQVFEDLAVDRRVRITEGDDALDTSR